MIFKVIIEYLCFKRRKELFLKLDRHAGEIYREFSQFWILARKPERVAHPWSRAKIKSEAYTHFHELVDESMYPFRARNMQSQSHATNY